ncbi:hypothetical protein BpHYR1_022577 [Brachionus plicatilis]|uniref:Uncharacterized protein n=1 Tax=Brachionus plicatilis TaxID=10195 RepID=A0A3M7RY54_BRAPC|nr:hypothetical protein BpHYR1_022577 [Brachionus plicatilis]
MIFQFLLQLPIFPKSWKIANRKLEKKRFKISSGVVVLLTCLTMYWDESFFSFHIFYENLGSTISISKVKSICTPFNMTIVENWPCCSFVENDTEFYGFIIIFCWIDASCFSVLLTNLICLLVCQLHKSSANKPPFTLFEIAVTISLKYAINRVGYRQLPLGLHRLSVFLVINKYLKEVEKWLFKWKIKISIEKSFYMIFEKKTKINLDIKINNNNLNNEEKVKF